MNTITCNSVDGHIFQAYVARPEAAPTAGLLILQEIFGVTGHIRQVADGFARRGYLAVAPALFDRLEPGLELAYSDIDRGRELMQRLVVSEVALDLAATVTATRSLLPAGLRVGAVGYCWGGAIADLAACRTDISAAVAYYGRANVNWLTEKPRCPVMYHYGARDALIPPDVIARISAARPGATVHTYADAGHGFNCNERAEFHPASAALALERTLAFLATHLQPGQG